MISRTTVENVIPREAPRTGKPPVGLLKWDNMLFLLMQPNLPLHLLRAYQCSITARIRGPCLVSTFAGRLRSADRVPEPASERLRVSKVQVPCGKWIQLDFGQLDTTCSGWSLHVRQNRPSSHEQSPLSLLGPSNHIRALRLVLKLQCKADQFGRQEKCKTKRIVEKTCASMYR